MQADMARVRSEVAGLAADHKAERSQWQEKLNAQQGHEQRYKLEVDRLEGEKAALQEKLRRRAVLAREVGCAMVGGPGGQIFLLLCLPGGAMMQGPANVQRCGCCWPSCLLAGLRLARWMQRSS